MVADTFFHSVLAIPKHDAATPVHHAAEEGENKVVEALLEIGADANELDSDGQTPLHLASSWGHASSCRLLVCKGGANIDAQDDGGDTPLHEAARADELAALLELLRLGADKDSRNKMGATPLILASHKGHSQICKALILAGAAVNGAGSQMRGDYSPLHAAAASGSTECLKEIVDAGASLRHSASESSLPGGSATALELAEGSGQRQTASLLRNASISEFEKFGLWGRDSYK